ncbi:MAG: TlyA family RNA methyltransferase [Crocinitomicaceae bacterium]|nr:TlyA family RNA methyltransferase [Crocinitomicaceae bacterium]
MEERLDKILVNRGLISTRVRAEKMIEETGVKVNGKLITKPGKKFMSDVAIELIEEEIPWVSRGALKLIKALDHWNIDVTNKIAIDLGASTGGFTEVLLSKGIQKVFSVDVGTDQLHARIKENEKVIDLQKTHVRELTNHLITDVVDIVVIDVSFISLEKVFPFLHPFLSNDATIVALVKPQFEVGKENISKGGIVKNQKLYPQVIENIKNYALRSNLTYQDHIESPLLGGDGNREFLMWLKKNN